MTLSVTCWIEIAPPHTVVDGTVVVRDASSRNRIFVVDCGDASSFVLKQGTSAEGVAAVAYEAAVYNRLGQRGQRIIDYLPAVSTYDPVGQVLVLGKVSGDRDLRGSPNAHRPIVQGARQFGRRCPRGPPPRDSGEQIRNSGAPDTLGAVGSSTELWRSFATPARRP